MRNLFALIGFTVVGFLAAGWYLNWYTFSRVAAPGGVERVQFDIRPKKIGEDARTALDRGKQLVKDLRNSSANGSATEEEASPAIVGPPRPDAAADGWFSPQPADGPVGPSQSEVAPEDSRVEPTRRFPGWFRPRR